MENPADHFALLNQGVRFGTGGERDPKSSPAVIKPLPWPPELFNVRLNLTVCVAHTLDGAKPNRRDLTAANFHTRTLMVRADDVDLGRNRSRAHATLRGAILGRKLSGADASKWADLHDAMVGTEFGAIDLSEAKGLDQVRHELLPASASTRFINPEAKSLRDSCAGAAFQRISSRICTSLVNAEEGIQFYSCFISYSSKDEEFARRLHGRMREAHLRVWFAPEDIQGGKKLHEQIETAIRVYDKLLIVLSEASLQSEWVMEELRKAFKAERQTGKRKLFPVRLTDYRDLGDAGNAAIRRAARTSQTNCANTSCPISQTGKITTSSRPPSPACSKICRAEERAK